jgi:hypothetical protein
MTGRRPVVADPLHTAALDPLRTAALVAPGYSAGSAMYTTISRVRAYTINPIKT